MVIGHSAVQGRDECREAFEEAEKEVNAFLVKTCSPFLNERGQICNGFNSLDVTAIFDKLRQACVACQRAQTPREEAKSKGNRSSYDVFKGVVMKPLIIMPKGAMSSKDKEKLTKNNICVVEAETPSLVKFVDSVPEIASRTQIEQAAIQLSRKVLDKNTWGYNNSDTSKEMAKMYVDLLVKGTPLDPRPTQEEQEKEIFNQAKADELRRLAREEARAERAAKKNKKIERSPNTGEATKGE